MADNFQPELAILDVMLPDGNGFSLMEQLKQKGEYPILFFTAHGEDEDKFKGFGLGADDYVVKPFLPKELTQPKNIFTMADYPSCTAPPRMSSHCYKKYAVFLP